MELLQDPEFWVGVGTLLFLGILLWQRVPKMITSALDARAAAIAKELEEAQRLRNEAEALLQEYKKERAEAEGEAATILREAKAEALKSNPDSTHKVVEGFNLIGDPALKLP